MASKDYYSLLGVGKTASADEIKKAYRKLALQYHPDRNKAKDASDKFKEVTKAYEVLSDTQKRQTYDQVGHAGFESSGAGQGFGGGNPFSGGFGGQQGPFSYSYSTSNGGDFGGSSDPFDIFEQFFGGGAGNPFGGARAQRRPVYSLTIDFMDAVKGAEKKVTIDEKSQTIKIPAGVDDGARIRFKEYDVVLSVAPHKTFKREGADVISEIEIPFTLAALGDTIDVKTVDGVVKLKVPAGTQPETVFRLQGKGIVSLRGGGKGNHYVKFKVVIPKSLTVAQKKLLEEFDSSKSKKSWF